MKDQLYVRHNAECQGLAENMAESYSSGKAQKIAKKNKWNFR